MKIIPVIDVLNGNVMHAIRGERKRYRPLKSVLCRSVNPLEIALTFESLGFRSLYLADLDAISGKPANFSLYQQIGTKTNLDLMVDAGITDFGKAKKMLETVTSKIVIGTETLRSLDFLEQVVKFGKERVLVSVDLKKGGVLSVSKSIASMNVSSLVRTIGNMGITNFILLDLDRVGTENGANVDVLKELLKKTKNKVLVGGGIRNLQELEELKNLGVHGVLIATALHNKQIKVDELKNAGFL